MTLAASSGGRAASSWRHSCRQFSPGSRSACSWARSSARGLRRRLSITWRKSIRRRGPTLARLPVQARQGLHELAAQEQIQPVMAQVHRQLLADQP